MTKIIVEPYLSENCRKGDESLAWNGKFITRTFKYVYILSKWTDHGFMTVSWLVQTPFFRNFTKKMWCQRRTSAAWARKRSNIYFLKSSVIKKYDKNNGRLFLFQNVKGRDRRGARVAWKRHLDSLRTNEHGENNCRFFPSKPKLNIRTFTLNSPGINECNLFTSRPSWKFQKKAMHQEREAWKRKINTRTFKFIVKSLEIDQSGDYVWYLQIPFFNVKGRGRGWSIRERHWF